MAPFLNIPCQDPPQLKSLGIVGVGLLGGSIALAARMRGLAERVVGLGRNPERMQLALDVGLIDAVAAGPGDLRDCDLIVLCTPVNRIVEDALQLQLAVGKVPLMTDVGSVKGPICAPLAKALPEQFVGSHPLAGSEQAGFEAARPNLFEGRTCVVTPVPESPVEVVNKISDFWRSLGMEVHLLEADEHDRLLALTSHLPHVAAAALAAQLTPTAAPLAATGFRDTTRVAAGDAALWAAILQMNATAVSAELRRLLDNLQEFRAALDARDGAKLQQLLAAGQAGRQLFTAAQQAGATAD